MSKQSEVAIDIYNDVVNYVGGLQKRLLDGDPNNNWTPEDTDALKVQIKKTLNLKKKPTNSTMVYNLFYKDNENSSKPQVQLGSLISSMSTNLGRLENNPSGIDQLLTQMEQTYNLVRSGFVSSGMEKEKEKEPARPIPQPQPTFISYSEKELARDQKKLRKSAKKQQKKDADNYKKNIINELKTNISEERRNLLLKRLLIVKKYYDVSLNQEELNLIKNIEIERNKEKALRAQVKKDIEQMVLEQQLEEYDEETDEDTDGDNPLDDPFIMQKIQEGIAKAEKEATKKKKKKKSEIIPEPPVEDPPPPPQPDLPQITQPQPRRATTKEQKYAILKDRYFEQLRETPETESDKLTKLKKKIALLEVNYGHSLTNEERKEIDFMLVIRNQESKLIGEINQELLDLTREGRQQPQPQPKLPKNKALKKLKKSKSISDYRRNLISYVTKTNYVGSTTPLEDFLKKGVKPTTKLDMIALEHDIRYTTATTDEEVNFADELFIIRLNQAFKGETIASTLFNFIVGGAMSIKTFVDRLPGSKTESLYVNYQENENNQYREKLLGIQQRLENIEDLTDESIDFVFKEFEQPGLEGKVEEDDEEVSELFGDEGDDEEDDEEYEGDEYEDEPFEGSVPADEEIIDLLNEIKSLEVQNVEDVKQHVETLSETERIKFLKRLGETKEDLYNEYFESILTPQQTQSLPARSQVTPPDLQRGWRQKQLEADLKRQREEEEEENRRAIYENNPDDYMAPPVPNSSLRPMLQNGDEWVDYEKLRYYGSDEMTKIEKRRWLDTWGTPFQMGEGHITNEPVVGNNIERLARREQDLRYNYKRNSGLLPRDYMPPAKNFGEPERRQGKIPRRNEAYRVYNTIKNRYNMNKYQYLQTQNKPPVTKLINREAQQYELTRDIPTQQRIYDEYENETPKIKIKSDADYAFYTKLYLNSDSNSNY
jgi:hypothetical protein